MPPCPRSYTRREVEGQPFALCPRNPKSLPFVEELVDQVLRLHPDIDRIHIGADEVWNIGVNDLRAPKRMWGNVHRLVRNEDECFALGYTDDWKYMQLEMNANALCWTPDFLFPIFIFPIFLNSSLLSTLFARRLL